MILNLAANILWVLLALDALFVSVLLVASAIPLIREWLGAQPSRQPTAARKPL